MIYGMVWYSMAWFGLLVLCKYITMQNFRILGLKMTELCLFKIFGIWYDMICHDMIWSTGII